MKGITKIACLYGGILGIAGAFTLADLKVNRFRDSKADTAGVQYEIRYNAFMGSVVMYNPIYPPTFIDTDLDGVADLKINPFVGKLSVSDQDKELFKKLTSNFYKKYSLGVEKWD